MALAIRMRQQGRTNRQTYRVVLTDRRAPRDGKYVEQLGWYNPFESEQEKQFLLDAPRIEFWIKQGAVISDKVKALMMKTAPQVIKAVTQRAVAIRAKTLEKSKARKNKAKAATPKAQDKSSKAEGTKGSAKKG